MLCILIRYYTDKYIYLYLLYGQVYIHCTQHFVYANLRNNSLVLLKSNMCLFAGLYPLLLQLSYILTYSLVLLSGWARIIIAWQCLNENPYVRYAVFKRRNTSALNVVYFSKYIVLISVKSRYLLSRLSLCAVMFSRERLPVLCVQSVSIICLK